jgi:putative oxidoreductase
MTTQRFRTEASTSRAHAERDGFEFLGRVLFSTIFVLAGAKNLLSPHAIQEAAAQGVPLASLAVPSAGILALAGGLSVLLGYRARAGAWLLVLFLAPVTLAMHRFWAVADPQLAQLELTMLLKNLSMLGGALLVARFGAGSWSLDSRRARRLAARTDS